MRQITEYIQRGMPREPDGRFDVDLCRAWIAANVKPTGRGEAIGAGATEVNADQLQQLAQQRAYWESYLAREKALVEELKRREREGELVEVDTIARRDERRITACKALLEQIPDRSLGLLPKGIAAARRREFRDRIAEMVEDALLELAEMEEAILLADEDDQAEQNGS